MHSSTSSSRTLPLRAIALALLLAVLACVGMELVARRFLIPSSRILSRTEREWTEAVHLRPGAGDRKTVVLLGNSLLDEDVVFPALQAELAPLGWDAHRLVIEQTVYLDWRYGIRRLIDEGSRPDAMVLLLAPEHFAADSVHGSIFANYLLRTPDWWDVMREAKLHPTDATGLLLARYSKFYGMRQEFRKNLLRKILPGWPPLTTLLIPNRSPVIGPNDIQRKATPRLSGLKSDLKAAGIRFLLVVPPVFGGEKLQEETLATAKDTGVTVIAPVRSGELPKTSYRDGFHMTPDYAPQYTQRLAGELEAWLKTGGD